MSHRATGSLTITLTLLAMGLTVGSVTPARADVAICRLPSGIVMAREGSCGQGEVKLQLPDTLTDLNCAEDQIAKYTNGSWQCTEDTSAATECAAGEVLLGGGGGCIPTAEIAALAAPKTFFVTSATFSGDLGADAESLNPTDCTGLSGLDAGDCICQTIADSAAKVPPGTYRAWLSDSTGSPNDRWTKSLGPYKDIDGNVIAANYAALVGTNGADLTNSPIVMDDGSSFSESVWTGTDRYGNFVGGDAGCENWSSTDNSHYGEIGWSGSFDSQWTEGVPLQCGYETHHLYCGEQ